MTPYEAPLRDMRFVLHELLADHPGDQPYLARSAWDESLVDAILEEAARFAREELSPLYAVGDREGAQWSAGPQGYGEVRTPPGFAGAYARFQEAGWMALPGPEEFGGQGLSRRLAVAVSEMWKGANLAFSHVVTLTHGAADALLIAADEAMQARWLPPLIQGRWTGTMNITEPQAGSDLAAITTRALPAADGSYRLVGQKIFITYGDHDMAENIVHLVLARTPDGPPGVKGLSLFLVPKFLLDDAGRPAERNDVVCTALEHKLGVRGSPTTTLVHGEHGGSTGYLVGRLGQGLEIMFVMMNSARLSVGTEGLGLAQRAWQMASAYARERLQGLDRAGNRMAIVGHPDVQRMLLTQRAMTEAIRALAYTVAALQDEAEQGEDGPGRDRARQQVELLTPVLKGWSTESAVELTSLAIQVFGGMGFVEETGIAQTLRDARITPIYEGTTAIQANDLLGRKILRDRGVALDQLMVTMAREADTAHPALAPLATRLAASLGHLARAREALVAKHQRNPAEALWVAVPFLRLVGYTLGGWQMLKSARVAQARIEAGSVDPFYGQKCLTARFYGEHLLPLTGALAEVVSAPGLDLAQVSEVLF